MNDRGAHNPVKFITVQLPSCFTHISHPVIDRANILQKPKSAIRKVFCDIRWIETKCPGLIILLKQVH